MPKSKTAIKKVQEQMRMQGSILITSTHNPGKYSHKAMSNPATWTLTPQSRGRGLIIIDEGRKVILGMGALYLPRS